AVVVITRQAMFFRNVVIALYAHQVEVEEGNSVGALDVAQHPVEGWLDKPYPEDVLCNRIPAILRDLVTWKWIADGGVANIASRSGVINLPENYRTAESIGSYHRTRLIITGERRIEHSRKISVLERGSRKLAEA